MRKKEAWMIKQDKKRITFLAFKMPILVIIMLLFGVLNAKSLL